MMLALLYLDLKMRKSQERNMYIHLVIQVFFENLYNHSNKYFVQKAAVKKGKNGEKLRMKANALQILKIVV